MHRIAAECHRHQHHRDRSQAKPAHSVASCQEVSLIAGRRPRVILTRGNRHPLPQRIRSGSFCRISIRCPPSCPDQSFSHVSCRFPDRLNIRIRGGPCPVFVAGHAPLLQRRRNAKAAGFCHLLCNYSLIRILQATPAAESLDHVPEANRHPT